METQQAENQADVGKIQLVNYRAGESVLCDSTGARIDLAEPEGFEFVQQAMNKLDGLRVLTDSGTRIKLMATDIMHILLLELHQMGYVHSQLMDKVEPYADFNIDAGKLSVGYRVK